VTDYINLDQFKQRLGVTNTDKDVRILEHISAASRWVDEITHRQFGPGSSSARYFRPLACDQVFIDDASAITEVAVDGSDTGSYTTIWATTYYETDPANGIGPDGQTGWPITSLRAVAGYTFPTYDQRRSVKVTATWGWAAIPANVVEATYLLANRLFYEVAVPGGIIAPSPDFGIPGAALQPPFTAMRLLKPYARTDRVIGVAG
jgi:hypothetical protein